MLRLAANGPSSGLYRSLANGQSRLIVARHASGGGSRGGGGRAVFYLFGTTAVAAGATTLAAKYDPDFRGWLATNAPYSVPFFRIVLQEGKPVSEELLDAFNNAKQAVLDLLFKKEEPKKGAKEVIKKDDPCKDIKELPTYRAPTPVFAQLMDDPIDEPPWKEIRIFTEHDADPLVVTTEKAPADQSLPETHPRSLAELESRIATVAADAVATYKEAYCAVREHGAMLHKLLDSTPDQVSASTWSALKDKTAARDRLAREAESRGKAAAVELARLQVLLAGEAAQGVPKELTEQAQRNAAGMLADMQEARDTMAKEREKASVTDQYWEQVQAARQHFQDEIQTLFPQVNLSQRKLELSQDELDLFILHAFNNVLFYQKELKKIETLGESRLRQALQSSMGDQGLVDACVAIALERDSRNQAADFHKQALCVRAEAEREKRLLMKQQAGAHQDHLQDAIKQKELETERRVRREYDDLLAQEAAQRQVEVAAMVGRMKGMDAALKARAELDRASQSSQALWAACQALHAALRAGTPGASWREQLAPLQPQVAAVSRAGGDCDPLVAAVVAAIPQEAVQRGVFTEEALRERFLKVERVARQVALVPDSGARIPLYLLSYLQSFLLVRAVSPIPQAELADQPVDLDSLDTYDLLQRARYWLDRGDFAMTLRYMHLLSGASRRVACDWMDEARILLETQQAATVLMAHAAATGLKL